MREGYQMIRILLVDDEPLSIEWLQTVMDWGKLGCEICGTCRNGAEAAAIIDIKRPDVIITDIRMPLMNGLELIRHIRNKKDNDIKFIILSGYNEFEYAKKAIQMEVRHYLLKPVFEEDIINVLNDIKNEIEQQSKDKKNSFEESNMAASSVIKRLIQGECSIEELAEFGEVASKIGIEGEGGWCYILAKTLKGDIAEYIAGKDASLKDVSLKQEEEESLRKLIDKYCKINNSVYIVDHDKNCCGLLVRTITGDKANKWLEDFTVVLAQFLLKAHNEKFYIAAGMPVTELSDIKYSYESALTALNYSFYSLPDKVIFYKDVKDRTLKYEFENSEYVERIIKAIEKIDYEELKSVMETEFSYFRTAFIAPEIIKMYFMNAIYRCMKFMRDADEKISIKQFDFAVFEKFSLTIYDIEKLLYGYCKYCCDCLDELRKRDCGESIYKIEKYIKKNYKNSITIKDMSKKFYMHPVYLGQLINKKFGMSFNEYIHKLRVEEAKRLLEETSMKVNEIAIEIGYSSYSVFLQYFEKNTGVKPMDFKKRDEHQ